MNVAASARPHDQPTRRSPGSVLWLPASMSYIDRLAFLPLVPAISQQSGIGLDTLAASIAAFFIAYGVGQPAWGLLSDRLGRRVILMSGLGAMALGAVALVVVESEIAFVAIRAFSGLASGALVPTTLAAVGDTVAPSRQQGTMSAILGIASLLTAVAMLSGGIVAGLWLWQLPMLTFAVSAGVAAAVLGIALPRDRPGTRSERNPLGELWRHRGAAVRLYLFAVFEGAILLGSFPMIALALGRSGFDSGASGMTMAFYGLAAVGGSVALRITRLGRAPMTAVLLGAVLLVLGLGIASLIPLVPLPAAAVASLLLGAAFSLFHTKFQSLAAQLTSHSKGIAIGLFAGSLFTGAAIGTIAGDALVLLGGDQAVFLGATVLAVAVTIYGIALVRRGEAGR